jgi:hypothetical protein
MNFTQLIPPIDLNLRLLGASFCPVAGVTG